MHDYCCCCCCCYYYYYRYYYLQCLRLRYLQCYCQLYSYYCRRLPPRRLPLLKTAVAPQEAKKMPHRHRPYRRHRLQP